MEFLYPFLNFLQPGDLWTVLIPYRPILVASVLAGVLSLRPTVRPDAALLRTYFHQPIFYWLCAFVVIQVVSVYYSGVLSMIEELSFWEVYPLYIAISLLTIRDAASLRRYIWGTMIGSACVIFYGLHAVAVHSPGLAGGRAGAYGMYENHNDYSFIIVMVLPFAWLYLRVYRRLWQKLLLLVLISGGIAGIFLSLSRGGILALVLEIAMLLGFTTRGPRRMVMLAALAIIGTGAITYQFAAREANQAGQYTEEDAKDSRLELWKAARAMIVAHPILGVGSRRFLEFSTDYGEISHDNLGKGAHNTYLEVAADSGVLGFGCFMLMLWGTAKALRGTRLADAAGDGIAEVRLAALVSLYTILFRAVLDSKVHDWSFYFLAIVAIATQALMSTATVRAREPKSPASSWTPVIVQGRPMVYRHR
jgi:O-antigen ligase